MFAVELQQEMEREWNMKVSLNHVKSITIGMLKEYQSGNLDNIRKHMDEIKRARANLLKQKFIIPTEPIVKLNAVTTGRPVYLMPTLSINFIMFEELSQQLNRPVIGLNWTREVCQLSTLKEVGNHYVNLLKHIEPKGKYDVVGYLDTALICGKLLVKGMADKVVIVDLISDVRYCDEELTDDMVMEFMLTIMSAQMPNAFKDKILRNFKKEADIKGKVKFIVNEIVDFAGKGLVATDMEEMFHIMIARIPDKIRESGGRDKRMVAELWRALGIDPDNTPDHLTLGEIGLESMFAVELQQEMEREWNMKVSVNHVKSITIGMLKEYQSGNLVNIRKHMDEIKRARANLLKQKFIMPTEPIVKLNAVTTGRPVYLMPTLSINFIMFEELAQKLNRPVIGLNWTREVCQLFTLKEVGHHYFNLLKHIEPKGKYDVVGYLDTALICGKLLVKGMADKVVIVDLISDVRYCDEELTDDMVMEFMLTIMSAQMPNAFKDKILRNFKKEADIKGKVKFIVNEIVDFAGKGLVATDMEEMFYIMIARIHMEEMFYIMIARIRMLSEYRLNKRKKVSNRLKLAIAKKWTKKTGKLVLIKPVNLEVVNDLDALMEETRDIYFLPEPQDELAKVQMENVDTQSTLQSLATEDELAKVQMESVDTQSTLQSLATEVQMENVDTQSTLQSLATEVTDKIMTVLN
ncbi:unnamed protein product [Oppiella nova]|uniref:Carrier domain-containing protein n=1 Tax=Oppiella nova TaxID=334625 RepID=A0A7R9LUT5_9ACAR|nr:unnamed protein product [Oppiella nova]CAG2167187.1 unnamed protein product [Oppiella nova]